jgi:hypothetical protein
MIGKMRETVPSRQIAIDEASFQVEIGTHLVPPLWQNRRRGTQGVKSTRERYQSTMAPDDWGIEVGLRFYH